MNDTVVDTGNDGANTTNVVENDVNDAAPQSEGLSENASANQKDLDTSDKESGKVADADNDKADDEDTQEGGEQNQDSGYEFDKIKLPDGFTATDEQKAEFAKDAEALGIKTQDGAQRFIDWILEKAKMANTDLAKQQENDIGSLEKTWTDEGKKDPVLGKDYDKNVSDAMDVASKMFSPRTMEFLKETRFEKNPDFLKDMLRIAKERADAELFSGSSKTTSNKVVRDSQGRPMLTFK